MRAAGLTLLGLVLGWGITRYVHLDRRTAAGLTLVVIGTGISAAAGGAIRSAGRGARLKWLLAGVVAGIILVALR